MCTRREFRPSIRTHHYGIPPPLRSSGLRRAAYRMDARPVAVIDLRQAAARAQEPRGAWRRARGRLSSASHRLSPRRPPLLRPASLTSGRARPPGIDPRGPSTSPDPRSRGGLQPRERPPRTGLVTSPISAPLGSLPIGCRPRTLVLRPVIIGVGRRGWEASPTLCTNQPRPQLPHSGGIPPISRAVHVERSGACDSGAFGGIPNRTHHATACRSDNVSVAADIFGLSTP